MLTPLRTRHPLLLSVGLTLGLLLAVALAGTAVYILHLPLPTPVPLAFVPIALALAIWARRSHQWGELGYRRPRPGRYAMIAAGTIVLVLAITAWNIGSWHWDTVPGWLAVTLLVAFVEETFFRGVVLRLLLPCGWTTAWILSSIMFGLGHVINLINGYQSAFTTLMQVCFALAWGLFAAAVYADTGSIWPVFVFHALFDAIQLAGVHQTSTPVDITTLAVMASAAILIGTRAGNSAVTSPNGVSGSDLSVGAVQG
jgi:membrane protease YdiL (CAAX protease family)